MGSTTWSHTHAVSSFEVRWNITQNMCETTEQLWPRDCCSDRSGERKQRHTGLGNRSVIRWQPRVFHPKKWHKVTDLTTGMNHLVDDHGPSENLISFQSQQFASLVMSVMWLRLIFVIDFCDWFWILPSFLQVDRNITLIYIWYTMIHP